MPHTDDDYTLYACIADAANGNDRMVIGYVFAASIDDAITYFTNNSLQFIGVQRQDEQTHKVEDTAIWHRDDTGIVGVL